MNKKLTDNEIKKALECSVKDKCPECPYFHSYPCDQCRNMRKDALALINRIQAENGVYETCNARKDEAIRHLEAENERLKAGADSLFDTLDYRLKRILKLEDNLKTAKAEAYKEFAEKYGKLIWELKNEYLKKGNLAYASALVFSHTKLQNFLKELVGEDNESKN